MEVFQKSTHIDYNFIDDNNSSIMERVLFRCLGLDFVLEIIIIEHLKLLLECLSENITSSDRVGLAYYCS